MIELREYQNASLDGIREHFVNGLRRVILIAPTGGGKTVMFSKMVSEHLRKRAENRAVILTHRSELFTQAGGTLAKFNIHHEPITGTGKRINRKARCYVGMVKTYLNRIKKLPDLATVSMIILDECHYGDHKPLLKYLSEIGFKGLIIGATATPITANKKDPLSNYYEGIVNRVQIADLIELGFLSPCITYVAHIDRKKLKKENGEYTEESQMEAFATRTVYAGLLARYKEVCDRHGGGEPLRTICFNINIEHSLAVRDMFISAGYRAVHVDGMTPDEERKRIIAAYQLGHYDIICNVGILNAGFDDPPTRIICFNRATTSVPLWLQSAGRGSRIYPGKDSFILMDMGDNWTELGTWEMYRDWDTIWCQKKKPKKLDVVPMKTCPEKTCGALVPIATMTCPHCGYMWPPRERETNEETTFVELTSIGAKKEAAKLFTVEEMEQLENADRAEYWPLLSTDQLERLRVYRGRNNQWPVHVIRKATDDEKVFRERLKELASIRGHQSTWAYMQPFK